jgi:hypothetical protein
MSVLAGARRAGAAQGCAAGEQRELRREEGRRTATQSLCGGHRDCDKTEPLEAALSALLAGSANSVVERDPPGHSKRLGEQPPQEGRGGWAGPPQPSC